MSNLNFNGENSTPTYTLPGVSTDRGKVFYALMGFGAQTARELRARSGCLGAQVRANELITHHNLPVYTTKEPYTRADKKVVEISRYHINERLINRADPNVKGFMDSAKKLYGDGFSD